VTGQLGGAAFVVAETVKGGANPAGLSFVPGVSPSAEALRRSLNTISALNGNVEVQGRDGGPFIIVFTGALAGQNVGTIVSNVLGNEVQRVTFVSNVTGGNYH